MKISVELVPRDAQSLEKEVHTVHQAFPKLDMINIPDLPRFSLRSWEGCSISKKYYENNVPHLRAIDFDLNKPLPFEAHLTAHGIDKVLILKGDAPQDLSKRVYPSNTLEMIKKIKRELPNVKVYAAIDQFRGSLRSEYDYIQQKKEAGADGFFTQPFFDIRLLAIYAEFLRDTEVFWGISPVTSEKAQSYWETKNHAVFPTD
ncbi:MAG: methylenetetrahydrofolate reductase, partial [Hyphomonadaceae bacterium]|nr:methylenetetrahydrofolate reductase [Clostridia bacterium]